MIKKIIYIVFLFFLLLSCWSNWAWWERNEIEPEKLTPYNWKNFSIDLPEFWEDLSWTWFKDFSKLKNWKLELISFWSEKNWFHNNLVIISKELDYEIDSYNFALKNNPKDYELYEYFFLKNSKEFIFSDWDKSILYEFIVQYNKDSKDYLFMQIPKICAWKKSFFLTIWLNLDIKDTTIYENILKSFKCK